jgi:thiol-disulfide isomerase/thioredoxin
MSRKDITIAAIALSLLAVTAGLLLWPGNSRPAPNLSMDTLQGGRFDLKKLRGRPVLVNFWATTCTTCLKEMPHLIALYKELNPRGLEVIGITMSYDQPIHVVNMIKDRKIPYPVATDIYQVAQSAFGIEQPLTPNTYLISPQGRIVFQKWGLIDMKKLRARILKMLDRS